MRYGTYVTVLAATAVGLISMLPLSRLFRRQTIGAMLSRRNLLLVLLPLGTFALGLTMQKYRYFPYHQITVLAQMVTNNLRSAYATPDKLLSRQYSRDSGGTPLDRDLDTALLPLKVKGIRLSEYYQVPKTGGAITAMGNAVIVLDRLGNIYSYQSGAGVHKLPFPALPNNIADYAIRVEAKIDERYFRAHDIKYSSPLHALAVSHEYFDKEHEKTRLAVSMIGVDEAALRPIGTWKTIYWSDWEPAEPNESGGGALAFGGSEKLYLTVGDYLSRGLAQDPASSFGKVDEINTSTLQVRHLTVGHRNPQGLAVMKTGTLMSTEHGPAGGDELNQIAEGSNYGWPNVTLGTDYGTYGWHDNKNVGRHGGYQAPMFAWVPSIGVSNLIQVEGFHARWDDDLLVASLKAESLFRLRLDGSRVLYSEPIYVGQRIRDIAQLPDGAIVLWTDDTQLLFVSVDRDRLNANTRSASLHDALRYQCMYCHHFGPTNPTDFAPSLSHLFNRKIASDNFRYTAALRGKDGVWTEQRLREFLAGPGKFASGTSMPPLNLDPDAIDEIIRDLGTVDDVAN